MKLENGSIINQYKILSPIGKGGMGEVFLAQDMKLDRKVALKILPSEFAEDKDRMSRFVREAKSASALNHPNIITIHEIGESDGTHFIATEFIDGKTLNEYKQVNPLNYKSALEIAIQVASALNEAHLAGIVHRDIKPDNVMVRSNGLAKILDFGIAKVSASSTSASDSSEDATAIKGGTSPGMIIGTANYMSPEQAKGKEVDARTDIFSFGVILYEMIAGHTPFAGENALEMIGAILKDEPKPLNSDVPTEITKIINKCLRKDRDERYQTIKDVLIDLKDVKQDLEFQDKLERSIIPNQDENKTQILQATTSDEINQTTTNQTVASNPRKKYFAAGLMILLLAVGGFFGYKYFAPTDKQINSIAVLPFENRSGNADSEYLADGLAESLIYRLSHLPNLKVSPTSSVFRYKGKDTDPQAVANELGVDSVMTGRITQRGDNLTISVELVDVRNNKLIWGEQYERKMSELLATQREIASEITGKLRLKLSGEGERKLAKKYTDNPEAYQLYLKGRFYWNKRTGDGLKQSVEYYNQAIEKDPNFALAFGGLAQSYVLLGFFGAAQPKDLMPKAKAAAQRALELDDSLAEAHAALGIYLCNFAWNLAAGEKEFRRAIELNPNYATAYQWLGNSALIGLKRFDEAIAAGKKAEELDPLSPVISADVGVNLYAAERFDEAIVQFDRALSLDPNFPFTRFTLGRVYDAQSKYAEAIREYRKALELDTDNPVTKAYLAASLAKSGNRRNALKILDELKAQAASGFVPPMAFVRLYAGLGDKESAFAWMEKDFENRSFIPPYYPVIPAYKDLRGDPRFDELMRRVETAKTD